MPLSPLSILLIFTRLLNSTTPVFKFTLFWYAAPSFLLSKVPTFPTSTLAAYSPIWFTALTCPLTVIVPFGFNGIDIFPSLPGINPGYGVPYLTSVPFFLIFAISTAVSKTSFVGVIIYRAPVLTTPVFPITIPSELKK